MNLERGFGSQGQEQESAPAQTGKTKKSPAFIVWTIYLALTFGEVFTKDVSASAFGFFFGQMATLYIISMTITYLVRRKSLPPYGWKENHWRLMQDWIFVVIYIILASWTRIAHLLKSLPRG